MVKTVRIFIAMLFITGAATNIWAQKVKNGAYNATLKTLLSHSVDEIDVRSAYAKRKKTIFIDTRTARENEVSHIPGAIWVGYKEFTLDKMKDIDTTDTIIVYCSVGYRSEKITEQLNKAGYKNASNLYGGIFEWVNQGKEVVNTSGPTQEVHAYNKAWGVWLQKGTKVYN